MKNKTFNVREKSVQEFIKKYFVEAKGARHIDFEREITPYNAMQDSIYVRKEIGLEPGSFLRIELLNDDKNNLSDAHPQMLAHVYLYEVKKYDDLLLELELNDFKVELRYDKK